MFKNKAVIVVILVVFAVPVFFIISSNIKDWGTQKTSPASTTKVVEKEKGKDVNDVGNTSVESILEDVQNIVKWESDEYSRATILWRTEKEELKLDGVGYLFGDVMGSKVLKDKHAALQVYLRDASFEHDMYNVGSLPPGTERSILKLGGVGCELYIRDMEIKDSTDMGLLCTELPEEVTSVVKKPMSEKRARSIAETGECVEEGTLKENAFYNENSKTWWIDLNIDKPRCNPACVIFEDESVEINWRCTGLIAE